MFNGSITKAIQSLPPELQEEIYKKYLTLKIRERFDLGWSEIHKQILSAPFCDYRERITNITLCRKCEECGKNDLCYLCFKNGKKHFFGYPVYDFNDLEDAEFGYNKYMFLKYI